MPNALFLVHRDLKSGAGVEAAAAATVMPLGLAILVATVEGPGVALTDQDATVYKNYVSSRWFHTGHAPARRPGL